MSSTASRPAAKPAPAKPGRAKAASNTPMADGTMPGTSPRLQDMAVATAMVRTAWTRERATFLMRVCLGLAICLFMSIVLNFLLALQPQQFRYIWTDAEGKLREITVLSEPSLSDVEVASWTASAMAQAYTLNFAEFRAQQIAAQQNFTSSGWRAFQTALERSNTLQTVQANKYVMTAVPTGAPVILASGQVQGRWAWKVQFPIVVTLQSSSAKQSLIHTLEVLVVRQRPDENPRGIGIAQVNFL